MAILLRIYRIILWFLYEVTKNEKIKILKHNLRIKVIACEHNNSAAIKKYVDYISDTNKNGYLEFQQKSVVPYSGKNSVKLVAFYLPQFYSFKENDKWHGKNFTEWTNVTNAIPMFYQHYQPKLPIDTGFYNLENTDVMKEQIELAKYFGIHGFCFYYYWFSGKKLMEKPIYNFLNNKDLDFPFFLCWANEPWLRLWNGSRKETLQDLTLNEKEFEPFIKDLLPFIKDSRYMKVGNKPILEIYRPNYFSKDIMIKFTEYLRKSIQKEGFDDLYLICVDRDDMKEDPKNYGIDSLLQMPPHKLSCLEHHYPKGYINPNFDGTIYSMEQYIKTKQFLKNSEFKIFKGVFPDWDNSSRKSYSEASIYLMNPDLYKQWLTDCVKWTQDNLDSEEQFVFINAWNEWAEGATLEPNNKYGYTFLNITKDVLNETGNL